MYHKNGVRSDNRACNLEWTTHEETSRHEQPACLRVDIVTGHAVDSSIARHVACIAGELKGGLLSLGSVGVNKGQSVGQGCWRCDRNGLLA